MPGPILHLGATVLCMHAGPAQPIAPFPRVTLSGQPVVTLATPHGVTGCALASTSSPPCVSAQWLVGATRVLAGGTPVAIATGTAACVPTGTGLLPVSFQLRASAT
jgi:hypothetical protein